METRANYVLIGAFTLLGFAGLLGFFLWFAQMELDRQFAVYDIDFRSVSGLSDASDVRFAGLSVGRVTSVALSRERPGLVRVRVEIDGTTPVRVDSIATIEAQGVTGVSYVGISAGAPDAPLLADASDREVPIILAGQSALQSITEDAPELLTETLELMRELRDMVGGENQARVQNILSNVEEASEAFSLALEDFSAISGTVTEFTEEIGAFNDALATLTGDASGLMDAAETALKAIEGAAEDGRVLIGRGGETLDGIDTAVVSARNDLSATAARLDKLSLDGEETLARARESLAEADLTMARLRDSFDAADLTMETVRDTIEPGKSALEAARTAFAGAEKALDQDLPELTALLRSTLTEIDSAVARMSADLPELTGSLLEASRSAESAFQGIERAVATSTPAIRDFAQTALPQYGRLAVEARALVDTLDRLFEQLRRDPGRFFVEPRAPEYRR